MRDPIDLWQNAYTMGLYRVHIAPTLVYTMTLIM
jgi:hypothetical protein